jgi:hypothetical protein
MPADTFSALPAGPLQAAASIVPTPASIVPTPASIAPTTPPCCQTETPPTSEVIECHICQFECPIAQNWHWILSGLAGAMAIGAGIWTFCLLRK